MNSTKTSWLHLPVSASNGPNWKSVKMLIWQAFKLEPHTSSGLTLSNTSYPQCSLEYPSFFPLPPYSSPHWSGKLRADRKRWKALSSPASFLAEFFVANKGDFQVVHLCLSDRCPGLWVCLRMADPPNPVHPRGWRWWLGNWPPTGQGHSGGTALLNHCLR